MTYAMRQSVFQESSVMRARTDEAAIVQAARGGDLESFNTLVLWHQDRIYNLAYRWRNEMAVGDGSWFLIEEYPMVPV